MTTFKVVAMLILGILLVVMEYVMPLSGFSLRPVALVAVGWWLGKWYGMWLTKQGYEN